MDVEGLRGRRVRGMMRGPGAAQRAVVGLGVVAWCWCVGTPRGSSEPRVTDEELVARFHQSHNMMEEQLGRLRGILDAFLLGDSEMIQRYADEIDKKCW